MPSDADLLEQPQTTDEWAGLRIAVDTTAGVAFGMVSGQAIEVLAGGRAYPPGIPAWTGAIVGGLLGALAGYTVSRARRAARAPR